jgi:hypothetical protein
MDPVAAAFLTSLSLAIFACVTIGRPSFREALERLGVGAAILSMIFCVAGLEIMNRTADKDMIKNTTNL